MPFIHEDAIVLGNVTLGERASVWPTAVVRGDTDRVAIGDDSNVQDGAVLHTDDNAPCVVGARVTIGHRAIVHGATIEDDCLIGMGAMVLSHAVVGRWSLIGAGAVVPEGTKIPPGSIVLGIPAKVVRQVDDATRERIAAGARAYVDLAERHQRGEFPRRV